MTQIGFGGNNHFKLLWRICIKDRNYEWMGDIYFACGSCCESTLLDGNFPKSRLAYFDHAMI